MSPIVDTTKPQPAPPPGKYAFVGHRYWGEFPGYIYDPYVDGYRIDKAAQTAYLQQTGLLPPEPTPPRTPSPWEAAYPGAALIGVEQLVKNAPGWLGYGAASGGTNVATSAMSPTAAALEKAIGAPNVPGIGSGFTAPGDFGTVAGAAPEAPGMFSLGNIGAEGNVILPGLGLIGTYDVLAHDRGPVRGGLEGAASGAAIGSYFGMPWVGAGVGGLIGLGKSLFGGHGESHLEDKKRAALAEQGINLGPTKQWEMNPVFAQSRNESDLKGSDITDAADFYSKFGQSWANASPEQKAMIAQNALDSGAVREHNGGIDIDTSNAGFLGFAQKNLGMPVSVTQPMPRGGR